MTTSTDKLMAFLIAQGLTRDECMNLLARAYLDLATTFHSVELVECAPDCVHTIIGLEHTRK